MEEKKYPAPIFVEGMRFFTPREGAPSFVKGNIVIELGQLLEFAEKNGIKPDQPLRVDLLKSEKKGTFYFTLNTWKPFKKEDKPF